MAPFVKDPVCGMPLDDSAAPMSERDHKRFFFCSELCKRAFEWNADSYIRRAAVPAPDEAPERRRIAYFCMEKALDSRMPTIRAGQER